MFSSKKIRAIFLHFCLSYLTPILFFNSAFASEIKSSEQPVINKELAANKYNINLKYSIIGLGIEAWYKLPNSDQVGYKIDVNATITAGSISAAYFHRGYFWRKFYLQSGVGWIDESNGNNHHYGPGLDFVFGNDFYKKHGGILGIDWIGVGIYKDVTDSRLEERAILHFPKLKFSVVF